MNNYKDYYNYINNSYNQPLYNQQNSNNIYDPYEGFIRGNLFPNLYNGYKINPQEIKPVNEQAELLTYIDALTFACIDLNLYLDLNPDNKEAISLYNQYRIQCDEYTKTYEKKYGPLSLAGEATSTYPWAWNNSPWPWENR